jgi:hypothetical protein
MIPVRLEIFPENVNSMIHQSAQQFRQMLLNIAETYCTSLDCFTIDRGTVTFAFADECVTRDILDSLKIMSNDVSKQHKGPDDSREGMI